MIPESVTRTDSFALRAQRSEQERTRLMIMVFVALLVLAVVRRVGGGVGFSEERVFYAAVFVLLGGIAYESVFLWVVNRANGEGRLLAEWRWRLNASVEMAVPLSLLLALDLLSSNGEASSLSAPGLLLIPIIITLSVLRLRPRYTLVMGLVGGVVHALLVVRAIVDKRPASSTVPVLFSYSVLLGMGGVAGALVARAARRYVQEGAEEAAGREQARLRLASIEHDLSIARDIQRDLLPRSVPELRDFDIAGFNRPADLTGGDYYDWQMLPDGRLAVVLADVTGHGIGPALVMAVCRAYARASAPLHTSPRALLERLNALVYEDVRGGRFITLVIALLDPAARRIELLSAGHGPTLLYRASDRSVEQFGGDGMPLGVVPDEQYGDARVLQLQPGDVLLMMTDGFFEWPRASDRQAFGTARIESLLRESAHLASADLVTTMDDAVRAYAEGSIQNDDMTAVAIKFRTNP
jgi:serine phosphatase RsbU (regulator of sigma subunit)